MEFLTLWKSKDTSPKRNLNDCVDRRVTNFIQFCQTTDSKNRCWVKQNPHKTHHRSHNCKENHFFNSKKLMGTDQDWAIPLYYFLFVDPNNVPVHPWVKRNPLFDKHMTLPPWTCFMFSYSYTREGGPQRYQKRRP